MNTCLQFLIMQHLSHFFAIGEQNKWILLSQAVVYLAISITLAALAVYGIDWGDLSIDDPAATAKRPDSSSSSSSSNDKENESDEGKEAVEEDRLLMDAEEEGEGGAKAMVAAVQKVVDGSLEFRDICYDVQIGGGACRGARDLRLLHSINGYAMPGTLTALMVGIVPFLRFLSLSLSRSLLPTCTFSCVPGLAHVCFLTTFVVSSPTVPVLLFLL